MSSVFSAISVGFLPVMAAVIIAYGLAKKAPVYDYFIDGAKEGLKTAVDILPFMIGIYLAVNGLTASGLINFIYLALRPFFNFRKRFLYHRSGHSGTHKPGFLHRACGMCDVRWLRNRNLCFGTVLRSHESKKIEACPRRRPHRIYDRNHRISYYMQLYLIICSIPSDFPCRFRPPCKHKADPGSEAVCRRL